MAKIKINEDLRKGFDALFRFLEKGGGDFYSLGMWFDGEHLEHYEQEVFETSRGNDVPLNPYFINFFERLVRSNYDEHISYFAGNDYDSYYKMIMLFYVDKRIIEIKTEVFERSENDDYDYINISKQNEQIQNVITAYMESNGLDEITVGFSGSGDDGYIDNTSENGNKISSELMDVFYKVLNSTFRGFENDAGGEGNIKINLPEDEIQVNITFFDRELVDSGMKLYITE